MSVARQSPRMLDLDLLHPHARNVRRDLGDLTELTASIRAQGLIQPIVVTDHPRKTGHYLILAGHRRHAAAQAIPLAQVPCLIRHDAGGTAEHLALMLVENGQRTNLTAVEKARAMKALMDSGLNQSEIARRIGTTPGAVNQYVMLLDLDAQSLADLEAGDVQLGHARSTVKAARAAQRVDHGTPARGRPSVVEPAHFTAKHPLAEVIEAACTHSTRPYPSRNVNACGQCWEQAIRDDERRVILQAGQVGVA